MTDTPEQIIARAMVEMNINDHVLVRLTDRGRLIDRRQHDELRKRAPAVPKYQPRKTDEDGYSEWQLWELMQVFGSHISFSQEPPFETTIRIPRPGYAS